MQFFIRKALYLLSLQRPWGPHCAHPLGLASSTPSQPFRLDSVVVGPALVVVGGRVVVGVVVVVDISVVAAGVVFTIPQGGGVVVEAAVVVSVQNPHDLAQFFFIKLTYL